MTEQLGEYRVRTDFNPSDNALVDEIKAKSADLINLCSTPGMDPRLAALAQTAYEQAAMWAVKAATAQGPLAQEGCGETWLRKIRPLRCDLEKGHLGDHCETKDGSETLWAVTPLIERDA